MASRAPGSTLRHLHLRPPAHRAGAFPTYDAAVRAQTALQQRLLAWKAAPRRVGVEPPPPPPPPTLLSFTPAPTYTLGRRQTAPLGPAETARLTRPLEVAVPGPAGRRLAFRPSVRLAPRGGLATYHGPGQLVLWPVVDLRSPAHRHFTVHAYACLLEKTTMAALRLTTGAAACRPSDPPRPESLAAPGPARAAIAGFTDPENPGVWVDHRTLTPEATSTGEARKIAALGVHLRRHVTGLGVAINCGVAVDGPEPENPWARIVPCGLEGKGVTSVRNEMMGAGRPDDDGEDYMRRLASCWSALFAQSLFGEHDGRVLDVDPFTSLDLDLEAEGNWVAGNPRP